ncbi:MAG: UDP-N-acetylmuramoyl-L-alanine--D-glutamate ligase, partial [Syntrophales bacterium LBB04]|nr:UDP-N-acetylmuramoyl-L-alanine--D-glutamate ligase [Syntrophales bacterium LBB04]
MKLAGKRILIIGLGKTGLATARFLAGRDAAIVVTDEKPWEDVKALMDGQGMDGLWEQARYDLSALGRVDLIVPSPGVPPANAILQEALRRGLPIMSELELAYRFLSCPVIAITGTNGKTTTTTLTGNILKKAGKKVFVGGNIGDPLIGFADRREDADFAVVEVSSFQLQWMESFCPAVAVLLNTTCGHVNYHGSFAAYRRVKERIFANQTARELAIVNADEQDSRLLATKLAARVGYFSSTTPLDSAGTPGLHRCRPAGRRSLRAISPPPHRVPACRPGPRRRGPGPVNPLAS